MSSEEESSDNESVADNESDAEDDCDHDDGYDEDDDGNDSNSDLTDFDLDEIGEDDFEGEEDGEGSHVPIEESQPSGESQDSESQEQNPNSTQSTNWNLPFNNNAQDFTPSSNPVCSQVFTAESTPFEILNYFINDNMVNTIVEESNRYATQKNKQLKCPWSKEEFLRFSAVNFAMGLNKKPSINDYWRTDDIWFTPFFGNSMSRERYWELLGTLHFVNNEEIGQTNGNRFAKFGTFMEDLLSNFKDCIVVGEYLCLDESLVPFKGRLSIKQYTPKKRTRFGVKFFILADCATKFVVAIIPYQGKNTQKITAENVKLHGFGGATVVALLEPYQGKYHRVVVDNWFNSPSLARYLITQGTYIIGTVQKRRKGMPKCQRMKRKLKKGEIEVFSDGSVLVERWRDNRDVCMLNTFLPHSMEESDNPNPSKIRTKPGSVLLYNAKMGAVDESDKTIKPYKNQRKSYKWYRKVALHLIDIAAYNSFLIYRQFDNRQIAYKDYLEKLIDEILQKNEKNARARGNQNQSDYQEIIFPRYALNLMGKSRSLIAPTVKWFWEKESQPCLPVSSAKSASAQCMIM